MIQYSFSEELVSRAAANLNALIGVLGVPGSGKSYAALTIAEKVDPTFNIDRVCFSLEEFLKLLKSKLPKGSCVILDEAAVMANARTFQSMQNRIFNYIFITFRSSCLITFLCLPHITMLDSQAVKLLHYSIEPKSINRTTNTSTLNVLRIETNPWIKKAYKKHAWSTAGGEIGQVMSIECPLPSLKLRKEYEAKKAKFRDELGSILEEDINIEKSKIDHNKPKDFTYAVEEILKNKETFEREYSGRKFLDISMIKERYKVGQQNALRIKRAAEVKLYGK